MSRLLTVAGLGAMLLGGGSMASAQVSGRGYYDQGRAYGEFSIGRQDPAPRAGLFDHVRADLDRAEQHSYSNNRDLRRFNKVREELGEFQSKWANGHYDRHELDDAIGALQKVVSDTRLDYRDREVLEHDLGDLRDFRAHREYAR